MSVKRSTFFVLAFVSGLCSLLSAPYASLNADQADKRPVVYELKVDGSINPALADYILKGIEKAEEEKATCVVITMDTPGGAVTTTKTIIKAMLNAKLPVVVYVAPSGSSAASAGALITMSADVAAMAPFTNIGAAHPVSMGGEDIGGAMSEKIVNDLSAYMREIVARKGRNAQWAEKSIKESASITAKEALDIKVVNVIAETVPDLLKKLDGSKIEKEGKTYTFDTKDARVVKVAHGWRFKILDVIASPDIAYILMMIGGVGLMMEIYNPGLIFPGVLGGMCLLLSLFALQVLPVNYVGVALIILAVVLFILELKVVSFGLLSVAGIICLTLGSIMLFDTGEAAMRVSWAVVIPTVSMVSAFFIFALGLVVRAHVKKPRTGSQGLIGEIGIALTDLETEGKVAVHGEYWTARADSLIPKGERVRVIGMDGLVLKVVRDASG